MKLIFYLLLIAQLLTLLRVYADKSIDKLKGVDSIKWEKIEEKEKKIKINMWKSYKDDPSYFDTKYKDLKSKKIFNNKGNNYSDSLLVNNHKKNKTQINPLIPLNNFLDFGDFEAVIQWKSSFDGGISPGTGQQNPSLRIDYGFSEDSLLSLYVTGADDDLYNAIDGKNVPYYWQSYAVSYKKRILDNDESNIGLSMISTLEYWRIASGSDSTKSIYNKLNDSFGKDKSENIVGGFSFPITKNIGNKFEFALVPGMVFLPEKVGPNTSGKNSYGNNFYIGTGLTLNLSENLQLLASYINPMGPGDNYFDSSLNFSNVPIYSYGISWDVNKKIGLEGKITNSYGSSPSTGLLTIPSDNLSLYSANLIYNPYGADTLLKPLTKREQLISFGGLTVNNALIQDNGMSQGGLNYDSSGNLFFSYGYSLSNIFQLEFIDIGIFNDNSNSNKNIALRNNFLDESNLSFRVGGKLMIFSPQKNDFLWTSLRTSVGRNDKTNQGYIYSELINTFKFNNWMTINISPKYFYSGVESFGAFGFSKYITLSDNLQIIPEFNTLLKYDTEFNSTLSLRYSYAPQRSIDFYYSNAAGLQDVGQILKGEDKFGIKLNFIY